MVFALDGQPTREDGLDRDAIVRDSEAVGLSGTMEDGAWLEAGGTPGTVRRESAAVQGLCTARATRLALELQDADLASSTS
jgi:hypothetical protein